MSPTATLSPPRMTAPARRERVLTHARWYLENFAPGRLLTTPKQRLTSR